jgi:hypothetical protein
MTGERPKSLDQRLFRTSDAAEAPGILHKPPIASPKPGRMLASAPPQGVIWEMSVETRREVGACRQREADLPTGVRALSDRVHNRSMRECT